MQADMVHHGAACTLTRQKASTLKNVGMMGLTGEWSTKPDIV